LEKSTEAADCQQLFLTVKKVMMIECCCCYYYYYCYQQNLYIALYITSSEKEHMEMLSDGWRLLA